MAETLTFTLAAPLASFGELAGTRRSTQRTPSFSAVVGLLGAAMGVPRGDPALPTLAQEFAMAVRVDRNGGVTTDYHTVETPHARSGQRFRTRRDELAGVTGLVLTRRDYRQDVEYTVAVFPLVANPEISLSTLRGALLRPRYPLYAGRRSCQLCKPPNPRIVDAATVSDALGTENLVFDSRLEPGDCSAHHAIVRQDLLVGDRRFMKRTEYMV